MSRVAHHLVHRTAWEAADPCAPWSPPSLLTEGFVHLSFADQVDAAAARHFAPDDDLVVLTVDLDRLACEVVVEDLTGRGEAHPHAYGPLDRVAILAARSYSAA
jgi:uncharacterized protein (DUF952 family)